MLGGGDLMIAEKDNEVLSLRLRDFADRPVTDITGQIDPMYFRSDGTCHRFDDDGFVIHGISFLNRPCRLCQSNRTSDP